MHLLQFLVQVCNGIGTPVDFCHVELAPICADMAAGLIVLASRDAFMLWPFAAPRQATRGDAQDRFFIVNSILSFLYYVPGFSTAVSFSISTCMPASPVPSPCRCAHFSG